MSHSSKILLVDDDPLAFDSPELEDSGSRTVSASNGREALAKVAVEAPNLIRSCWIPGSWSCRCRPTQLLSPFPP
jgi:CheY-like chemotaxis protein